MAQEIINVNSFIRGYHEYQDEWEPTLGDVYKLMREPDNVKDSNAVAVVKEKSGEVAPPSTSTANSHPNNVTDKFEVIGHIPKLMAIWISFVRKKG
ncbi:hypothetical protein AC249_AIPGENE7030 [Exaiptasia diaphana]|nr:hypothetical protein AC249_AIPGENE7030 [Exaiptasia diaphana]